MKSERFSVARGDPMSETEGIRRHRDGGVKKDILAMQVVFGFLLCIAILWAWLHSPVPLVEATYPDGSQPIGWHSGVAALGVLLMCQYLSHLIFKRFIG